LGERVIVAGGGLGGALAALYLGRAGHEVEVYERRGDPRLAGAAGGRSINLAISTRGLHALEQVGLRERVLAMAVPMRGRMIHGVDGTLTFQPYGTRADQVIHSVSRLALNALLVTAAQQEAGVRLHFERRCVDLDPEAPSVEIESEEGSTETIRGTIVVGADGAYSAVRGRLQRMEGFDYAQSYLAHGYRELTIPAASRGEFRLEPHALHIWPRGGFMMIALPNLEGSFTCTLFWPLEGPNSFASIQSEQQLTTFFERTFPDALPHMPELAKDYFEHPLGSLLTVRCRPWHVAGNVVLLGDAAHAIVPFYGQGANAAFEDCVVLDECMRRHAPRWEAAFADFERRRKPHTDALAELAVENFLEMRDRVASRRFRTRKKLEQQLHRAFPKAFIPLYTMVTFTRTPYAQARARAARQWRVVQGVAGVLLLALLLSILLLIRKGGGPT
jgi:kynurenine 3-monooxygenase